MKTRRILVALFLICLGMTASFVTVWNTENIPSFRKSLEIDLKNYARGMNQIVATHDFLNLKDLFHSPGYQIYLGALRLSLGEIGNFNRIVKVLHWVASGLTIALVVWLGEGGLGLGWVGWRAVFWRGHFLTGPT